MAVKKVLLTQVWVDKASARPKLAGRIYDDLIEPVDLNKLQCITGSEKGRITFNVTLREDEKPVHLLARLAQEYETVVAESCRKTAQLQEICKGLKRLWPDAEHEVY